VKHFLSIVSPYAVFLGVGIFPASIGFLSLFTSTNHASGEGLFSLFSEYVSGVAANYPVRILKKVLNYMKLST
jgi:hypothetical protein